MWNRSKESKTTAAAHVEKKNKGSMLGHFTIINIKHCDRVVPQATLIILLQSGSKGCMLTAEKCKMKAVQYVLFSTVSASNTHKKKFVSKSDFSSQ